MASHVRSRVGGLPSPRPSPPPPLCLACFDSPLSSLHSRPACSYPRSSIPRLLPMTGKREHTDMCPRPIPPPVVHCRWASQDSCLPGATSCQRGCWSRTPSPEAGQVAVPGHGPTPAPVASLTSAAVGGSVDGSPGKREQVRPGSRSEPCRKFLIPPEPRAATASAGHLTSACDSPYSKPTPKCAVTSS